MKLNVSISGGIVVFRFSDCKKYLYKLPYNRIHDPSQTHGVCGLVPQKSIKKWMRSGRLHRLDGPAYLRYLYNGQSKQYWLHGKRL